MTAQGWAASELTDDNAWRVSLVSVAYFLPMFLFALPMGVAADRWDRRVTAISARLTAGVLLILLSILAATDHLTYRLLLLFAFLIGASIIAEIPARQAYVAQIVPQTLITQAAALTEVQGGISRFIGPIAAGWLIDHWGAGGGFAMFAGANFAFVWFFTRIRVPGSVPRLGAPRAPLHELAEGFRYLRADRDALAVVLISILAGIFGWVYVALLPVMTRGARRRRGHLRSAGNGHRPRLGALLDHAGADAGRQAPGSAVRRDDAAVGPRDRGVLASRWVPLSFVALAFAGLGFGGQIILVRSLLLRIVEPTFHGRVFGTMMLTWGANIIGTLGGGALAESLGVAPVIGVSGLAIVTVVGSVVAWNPRLLRI